MLLLERPCVGGPRPCRPCSRLPGEVGPRARRPCRSCPGSGRPLLIGPRTCCPCTGRPVGTSPCASSPCPSCPVGTSPRACVPCVSQPLVVGPGSCCPCAGQPLVVGPGSCCPGSCCPCAGQPWLGGPLVRRPRPCIELGLVLAKAVCHDHHGPGACCPDARARRKPVPCRLCGESIGPRLPCLSEVGPRFGVGFRRPPRTSSLARWELGAIRRGGWSSVHGLRKIQSSGTGPVPVLEIT